jgi:hypothetical protein
LSVTLERKDKSNTLVEVNTRKQAFWPDDTGVLGLFSLVQIWYRKVNIYQHTLTLYLASYSMMKIPGCLASHGIKSMQADKVARRARWARKTQ